ncbi:MAG: hypothetical protein ACREJO_09980 [Phycisphaerales bacterium]
MVAQRKVTGCVTHGPVMRAFSVVIGGPGIYRVDPLNPMRKHNRGRLCYVVEYNGRTGMVDVLFHDTQRRAMVDPRDLVLHAAQMPETVIIQSPSRRAPPSAAPA